MIASANTIRMTYLTREMAEERQESTTSDGAVFRMSEKAITDLLQSDTDLSSLSEESSDMER